MNTSLFSGLSLPDYMQRPSVSIESFNPESEFECLTFLCNKQAAVEQIVFNQIISTAALEGDIEVEPSSKDAIEITGQALGQALDTLLSTISNEEELPTEDAKPGVLKRAWEGLLKILRAIRDQVSKFYKMIVNKFKGNDSKLDKAVKEGPSVQKAQDDEFSEKGYVVTPKPSAAVEPTIRKAFNKSTADMDARDVAPLNKSDAKPSKDEIVLNVASQQYFVIAEASITRITASIETMSAYEMPKMSEVDANEDWDDDLKEMVKATMILRGRVSSIFRMGKEGDFALEPHEFEGLRVMRQRGLDGLPEQMARFDAIGKRYEKILKAGTKDPQELSALMRTKSNMETYRECSKILVKVADELGRFSADWTSAFLPKK